MQVLNKMSRAASSVSAKNACEPEGKPPKCEFELARPPKYKRCKYDALAMKMRREGPRGDSLNEVMPKLFIGDMFAARNWQGLLDLHNIKGIVTCTHWLPFFSSLPGYRYDINRFLTEHDDTVVERETKSMLRFVGEHMRACGVSLHCVAGAHRATTAGCLAIINFERKPVSAAVRQMNIARPCADLQAKLMIFVHRVERFLLEDRS